MRIIYFVVIFCPGARLPLFCPFRIPRAASIPALSKRDAKAALFTYNFLTL
jgi:hypothetical protein